MKRAAALAGDRYPSEPNVSFEIDPYLVRLVTDEPVWVSFDGAADAVKVEPPGETLHHFRYGDADGVQRFWVRNAGPEQAYVVAFAEEHSTAPLDFSNDPALFPTKPDPAPQGRRKLITSRERRAQCNRKYLERAGLVPDKRE